MSVFLSLRGIIFLPETEIEDLWKVCIQGDKKVNPKELDVQAPGFQMKTRRPPWEVISPSPAFSSRRQLGCGPGWAALAAPAAHWVPQGALGLGEWRVPSCTPRA